MNKESILSIQKKTIILNFKILLKKYENNALDELSEGKLEF